MGFGHSFEGGGEGILGCHIAGNGNQGLGVFRGEGGLSTAESLLTATDDDYLVGTIYGETAGHVGAQTGAGSCYEDIETVDIEKVLG